MKQNEIKIPNGWVEIRAGYHSVEWQDSHPRWGVLLPDGTFKELTGRPNPYAAKRNNGEIAILKLQEIDNDN